MAQINHTTLGVGLIYGFGHSGSRFKAIQPNIKGSTDQTVKSNAKYNDYKRLIGKRYW